MVIKKRTTIPTVELMVLSHNNKDISVRCLDLLYFHTISPFGLVWMDNGSRDGTADYLRKFAEDKDNMTLICSKANEGVIGGRNRSYEVWMTLDNLPDWFIILDNDQFVQKGWIEQYTAFMREGYDLAGTDARSFSDFCIPTTSVRDFSSPFSYVSCCGMAIKKHVTDEIGLFDQQFNPAYFEDPDFCYRAHDKGFRIGWNPRAKISHTAHQTLGQNPRKTEIFKNSLIRFRKKWGNRPPLKIVQKHVAAFEM